MTLKLVSNHPTVRRKTVRSRFSELDPVQIGRSAQWALFGQTPNQAGVLAWFRTEWAARLARKNALQIYPNSRISLHHTPDFPDRLELIRAGLNLILYEILDQNEEPSDKFQNDPGDEISYDEIDQFRSFLNSEPGSEEPESLELYIDPHEYLKSIIYTELPVTQFLDGNVIHINWPELDR